MSNDSRSATRATRVSQEMKHLLEKIVVYTVDRGGGGFRTITARLGDQYYGLTFPLVTWREDPDACLDTVRDAVVGMVISRHEEMT